MRECSQSLHQEEGDWATDLVTKQNFCVSPWVRLSSLIIRWSLAEKFKSAGRPRNHADVIRVSRRSVWRAPVTTAGEVLQVRSPDFQGIMNSHHTKLFYKIKI